MAAAKQDSVGARKTDTSVDASEVAQQLAKILASQKFEQSPRCAAFLKFVVEETLADRADFIKGRTVAIAVFDRQPQDNPEDDPIVRIQAGRVRKRLSQYYEEHGAEDPIRISIPTGSYVPVFLANATIQPAADGASRAELSVRKKRLPRIGVLPLANLVGSPEYDYFADGLGEELSAELARFQGLAVLAYWTTSQLRTNAIDLRSAGLELGADFFVCGSVARSNERVRISIECVQVETGDQIWAERFDRSLTTSALFDVQDEIVRRVVASVGDDYGSVAQSMFRASRNKEVSELTAYEAVLANHYYVRRLDQRTHDRTRAALEHAVEIEPNYALTWAMLSAIYCDIHAYDFSVMDEPLAKAEDCVQRAMTLDPNCQHAHYASAYFGALNRDHSRMIAAADKMVELNPNAAYMVGAAAFALGLTGRFDEAFPLLEHSLELNPYPPGWFSLLPWLHAFSERDYERALTAAHQVNMPTFFWDPLLRAATLGKLGQKQEAVRAFAELLRLYPDFAARQDHCLGCYIHSDDTRADVLNGLRVAGLR